MKSFQFARRIWDSLQAQCLISGAFGLFRKEDLIEVGGYDDDTIGEDMEVVLRLQDESNHRTRKQIVYEPEALCVTSVPHGIGRLLHQRDRWQRGLLDCLIKHRNMILNPCYTLLGLSLGYQLGFEMLGPVLCAIWIGRMVFGYGIPQNVLFLALYLALEVVTTIIAGYYDSEKDIKGLLRRLPELVLLTLVDVGYQMIIMGARVYGIITFRWRRMVW